LAPAQERCSNFMMLLLDSNAQGIGKLARPDYPIMTAAIDPVTSVADHTRRGVPAQTVSTGRAKI